MEHNPEFLHMTVIMRNMDYDFTGDYKEFVKKYHPDICEHIINYRDDSSNRYPNYIKYQYLNTLCKIYDEVIGGYSTYKYYHDLGKVYLIDHEVGCEDRDLEEMQTNRLNYLIPLVGYECTIWNYYKLIVALINEHMPNIIFTHLENVKYMEGNSKDEMVSLIKKQPRNKLIYNIKNTDCLYLCIRGIIYPVRNKRLIDVIISSFILFPRPYLICDSVGDNSADANTIYYIYKLAQYRGGNISL